MVNRDSLPPNIYQISREIAPLKDRNRSAVFASSQPRIEEVKQYSQMDDIEKFDVTPGPGNYGNDTYNTLEEKVKKIRKIDIRNHVEERLERGPSVGPGAYNVAGDISGYSLKTNSPKKTVPFGSKSQR